LTEKISSLGFEKSLSKLLPLWNSTDQIRQIRHSEGLAGAKENTYFTVPAVITVFHKGISLSPEMQYIHGAHIHTNATLVALPNI
jgi:hypothetical protein